MGIIWKGGACCLFYLFVSVKTVIAQISFLKELDVDSPNYGAIQSPYLVDSIVNHINNRDFDRTEWSSFYKISVTGSQRAVLGSYEIIANRIVFVPRFPPDPAVSYRVLFDYQSMFKLLELKDAAPHGNLIDSIRYQPIDRPRTFLTDIYPVIDTIPSNTLKLYLFFSQPMGFANPYDYINLIGPESQIIKNAFVEIPEGLWNEARTRLTLLFHPGRIKRGVGPNHSLGPVLAEGLQYELVIDKNWKDANGKNLVGKTSKKYHVSKERRNKIDRKDFYFSSSCPEDCQLLLVIKNTLIDIEMARNSIAIINSNQEVLDVQISYDDDGKSILFRSQGFYAGEKYMMSINPRLEDICGNSFYYVFDSEAGKRSDQFEVINFSFVIK